MDSTTQQKHWNDIYLNKQSNEVSWTQGYPATSLKLMQEFTLPLNARIIDIGGGDSKLVDVLLEKGYQDITVLDISATALEKAKKRLGENAKKIHWIVSDIKAYKPTGKFDVWHDRAAFHFLTTTEEIENYYNIFNGSTTTGAVAVIGTFSTLGPDKCSGLPVKKYDETSLTALMQRNFKKKKCITEDHITPFNTPQNFLYCSFVKK